jgi:hypothetical protein
MADCTIEAKMVSHMKVELSIAKNFRRDLLSFHQSGEP